MSRFRVLVLDLDGTAITRSGLVRPGDQAAAQRLKAAGVAVTIATGRLYPGTHAAATALGVEGTVAVMNGSEHVDVQSGRIRHRWSVPATARQLVREAARRAGMQTFLFSSDTIHHDKRAVRHLPFLRVWSDALTGHDNILDAPGWEEGDEVLGVSAVGSHAQIASLRQAVAGRLPPGLGVVEFDTFEGERFFELRHQGEDKASALHRLAEERGATAEETVAVGDWINDLPMLRVAGRSYAMRGSEPEVLAAAHDELPADRGQGGAVEAVARLVWGL